MLFAQVSGLRPISEQRTRGVLHKIVQPRAAVEDQPTSSHADKELIKNALGPVIEEMTKARTRTDFVAETLLPTTNGNFRVRAYRHWVRVVLFISCGQRRVRSAFARLHVDSEPSEVGSVPSRKHQPTDFQSAT